VGGTAVKLLQDSKCRIVAISVVSGGLNNKKGLNVKPILEFLSSGKNLLSGYGDQDAQRISNRELLLCDCDVLIPATMENQIDGKTAKGVRSCIVVEGAKSLTMVEAEDKVLENQGIGMVSDIPPQASFHRLAYIHSGHEKAGAGVVPKIIECRALACDHDIFTRLFDRFADHLFRMALAVRFRRVVSMMLKPISRAF
jgi:hypothetical protein